MSSVTELQQELIGNYVSISTIVLFLFESISTLPHEINLIWCREWTAITWLYALTRYSAIMDQLTILIPIRNVVSCKAITYIVGAFNLVQYICITWFSTWRVYALLEGRSKYLVPGMVMVLNFVPFATNMFNVVASTVHIDTQTCTTFLPGSNALHISLYLATRISVIISDVLILAVTWMTTAQAYREARRLKLKASLATFLYRDATIYFIIFLITNILQAVNNVIPVLMTVYIAGPFAEILPPIIICRFILGLRQIKPAGASWISGNQSHSFAIPEAYLAMTTAVERQRETESGRMHSFAVIDDQPDVRPESEFATVEADNASRDNNCDGKRVEHGRILDTEEMHVASGYGLGGAQY